MIPAVDYLYILGTLGFTVYGQLVLKWQVNSAGGLPPGLLPKALFLLEMLLNPWVLSGFASAFLASLCWIMVMGRFELSRAYPFMSLALVLTLMLSVALFHESVSASKLVGGSLVVIGVIVIGRG